MTDTPQDQLFLEYIIKLIVTNPDEIAITRTIDDLGVLITLKVAKEDMGRIIGKDGQTAKAIRTLLRAIGSRNEERINMKILEPEEEEGTTFSVDEAPAAAATCPSCGGERTEGHTCPAEGSEPVEEAEPADLSSDESVVAESSEAKAEAEPAKEEDTGMPGPDEL